MKYMYTTLNDNPDSSPQSDTQAKIENQSEIYRKNQHIFVHKVNTTNTTNQPTGRPRTLTYVT